MLQDKQSSDPKSTLHVTQRVAKSGVRAPWRIAVDLADGQATLTTSILCDRQRQLGVPAAHGVEGLPRVVDLLKLMSTAHHQLVLPRHSNFLAVSAAARPAAIPATK